MKSVEMYRIQDCYVVGDSRSTGNHDVWVIYEYFRESDQDRIECERMYLSRLVVKKLTFEIIQSELRRKYRRKLRNGLTRLK